MTKESVDAVIEILEHLCEVAKTDSERADSSYVKDYFKGCAAGYKIAIDTINNYLDYEKGGEI